MSNVSVAILISELISIFVIFRFWNKEDHTFFKVASVVFGLIPFVGPFLFLFVTDTTSAQSFNKQNRPNRYSGLDGYSGRYREKWDPINKAKAKEIERLKKEIESSSKDEEKT